MNPDGAVQIVGLDRFIRTLRQAGVDMGEMKDAHARVGELVASDAQAKAPRGRSGKLSASVRAARQVRRAVVMVGRAAVPYAGPIHWGWPARGIAAQPFASQALTESEPRWLAVYHDDLQAALNSVRGA